MSGVVGISVPEHAEHLVGSVALGRGLWVAAAGAVVALAAGLVWRSWSVVVRVWVPLVAAAPIVVLTLWRPDHLLVDHLLDLDRLTWWTRGWDGLLVTPDVEFVANVALFVPVAVAWTACAPGRRCVLPLLVAVAFLVETVQSVTGRGVADVRDLVANSGGAIVGVALAGAVSWAVGRVGRQLQVARAAA